MALTDKLKAVGDAIRAGTGKSDTLTLDQMPEEIASLGGIEILESVVDGSARSISLPNVTEIREHAFERLPNLTYVSMPNVKSIKHMAFYYCTKLALTSLPDSLVTLESVAFYKCVELCLETLPPKLEVIPGDAFAYCYKNTFKEIPECVKEIGDAAFRENYGLTELTFKGTPTSINQSAFYRCSNLTTINVPWAEGEVADAPWGAVNATINYNYVEG